MLRLTTFVVLVLLVACSSFTPPATPALSAQAVRGKQVFESYCARCHGTVGETVVVGPSLAGIASRAGARVADMDAEMYIRNSILNPEAYTVEGFPEGTMPSSLKDDLTEEDLNSVVAFLLTLK